MAPDACMQGRTEGSGYSSEFPPSKGQVTEKRTYIHLCSRMNAFETIYQLKIFKLIIILAILWLQQIWLNCLEKVIWWIHLLNFVLKVECKQLIVR